MQTELELIKAGANAVGLKLIGDGMIGYRFVPRSEVADFADKMLTLVTDDAKHLTAWCEKNKDADYNSAEWNS